MAYMPISDRIFLAFARTEVIFHEGLADQKFSGKIEMPKFRPFQFGAP